MTTPVRPTEKRIDPLFVILALFTVTFFVYRDFGIRMLYGFALLGLALGVQLVGQLRQDRPPVLDPLRLSLLVLTAAVLVNFLRPDSRHDADSVSFVISMLICSAFVVLSRPGVRTGRLVLAICFGGAVFLAAFVIFFEFNPSLFWKWFLMKLSDTAGAYLCYYVPKGYGFSLGGCTYTNYILFIGLSVCCGYIACGRRFDLKSVLAGACGAVFLYAILLVGRRGELLGAAICLVLLVLALCGKKQRRYLVIGGLAAGVLGLAILIPLLPWLRQFQPLIRYVMTFEQLLSGQDITSGRMELYALAVNAFAEKPLLGIGWDQFHTLIPPEFLALHGQDVEDVHNIYLQFLTETGIVGAPFLIAPLIYNYYLICTQLSRLKKCPGQLRTARMLCVTSFLVQSFLLVLGIYDPNFQRVIFWCFYALAVLMYVIALDLEGYVPDDPVSRMLRRCIDFCAPPFRTLWGWAAGLLGRKSEQGGTAHA